MGAYLSRPIFEPDTVCDSGRGMAFGASSVQGWRVTQEDAHNCILDYDTDCSLFAVYDGHGGSEVSKYCSLHLPNFIKGLSSYQAGDCKEALIDAFVKFDQTLTKPEVVEILKQLAQDISDSDGTVETDEDERVVLAREAAMPLEDLIRSYKTHQDHKEKDGVKKDETSEKNNGKPIEQEKAQNDAKDAAGKETDKNTESTLDSSGDHKRENDVVVAKSGGTPSEENTNGAVKAHGEASSSDIAGDNSAGGSSAGGGSSGAGSSTAGSSAGPASGRAAQRRATQRIKDKLNEAGEDDEDDDEDDEDDDDQDEDEDELGQEDDEDDSDEVDEEEEPDSQEDSEEELITVGGGARVGVDEDEDVEVFDSDVPGSGSGSTAVVALLKGDVLTVANAGDSRAVLCREGKAIDLSVDHKPEDAPERTRIERAGGKVTGDGRVNGGLNLSRAIGDHVYKQNEDLTLQEQMISPLPDVQTIMLDRAKDDFLVLACDGIWNCMTSQEVCDFVGACIRHGDNVGKICEQLFRKCIAPDTSGDGTGCDNMTCIIVRLNTESLQGDQKTGSQQAAETTSTEATRCNGAGGTQNNKRKSDDDKPSKRPRASS